METHDANSPPTAAEIEAVAKFERAFSANDPDGMLDISHSQEFKSAIVKNAIEAGKKMVAEGGTEAKHFGRLVAKVFVDAQLRQTITRIQKARFNKLEARIVELERQIADGPFKFMGPFTEGMDYSKGMFVSHQGGLWHCNFATRERPGTGYSWTLAVKRGADGKVERR